MKYLLFDENAIAVYVSEKHLQSVEFPEGKRLVEHICGSGSSELLFDTSIQYNKDGVLFVGKSEMWIQNVIQISIFFALT